MGYTSHCGTGVTPVPGVKTRNGRSGETSGGVAFSKQEPIYIYIVDVKSGGVQISGLLWTMEPTLGPLQILKVGKRPDVASDQNTNQDTNCMQKQKHQTKGGSVLKHGHP